MAKADQRPIGGVAATGNDKSDIAEVRQYKERTAPNRSFVAKMAGGGAPAGYHFMPDGSLMKDSDHMKKGGQVKKKESRVNEAGNYTKPELRRRLFNQIKAGGKGGKPGQWSARKAQMLAQRYKKSGGGYRD